ncbi:MAG TPA: RagB/SusD family nutrient uptake outer membrane protein, partial [Flavitalea sp.]|nr:RagB/SusD family nutrient uptake outer membrane protein [Flavitalea sp.]
MNSKNRILLNIGFCCCLAIAGCEKYLEQPPDNRTDLDSPEKVSQLLATAYPQANYMAFAESISDNVDDKGAGVIDNTNVDPYFFRDVEEQQQDSPEFYWAACYSAIAAANQALEACITAPDPARFYAQKGEALVARAYAHFMLVTFFSKTYNPTTASSDPGIPYVTEPEKVVFKKYERKTVAFTYDMIEKDLVEGLPLLDDKSYTVPKYHFTRAAANAFATRFYLVKREYQKVIDHANQVFPTANVVPMLRPWNTDYLDMTPQELFSTYQKATQPANLLLTETASWWGRNYYSVRYGMNSTKRSEIIGQNVTGGQWAFINQLYSAGTDNYLLPKINEYFARSSVNANFGVGYVMVPTLTSEEVLFNRAEAYDLLGNTTSAIADLNVYISTRINNYNPGTHNLTDSKIRAFYNTSDLQFGLLRTILDFKRAEYVQEGMRWFDLL